MDEVKKRATLHAGGKNGEIETVAKGARFSGKVE